VNAGETPALPGSCFFLSGAKRVLRVGAAWSR